MGTQIIEILWYIQGNVVNGHSCKFLIFRFITTTTGIFPSPDIATLIYDKNSFMMAKQIGKLYFTAAIATTIIQG